jgi:hypothetical protein
MFLLMLGLITTTAFGANSKECDETNPTLGMKCEVADPIKNEPTHKIPEKIETKKSSKESVSSADAAIPEKNPLREKRDRWKNIKSHKP